MGLFSKFKRNKKTSDKDIKSENNNEFTNTTVKKEKTKKKIKLKFSFENWLSFFESDYVKLWVLLLYIVITIVFGKMFFQLYTSFKENYISIQNLEYNIDLLQRNKAILEKNSKEIAKLRILTPKTQDYAQILYNIETIIKQSLHTVDPKFIVERFKYNDGKKWIKLKITGIKYYDDIKRLLFNLRRYKYYFDVQNLKAKLISDEDRRTHQIIQYYDLEVDIIFKWLF